MPRYEVHYTLPLSKRCKVETVSAESGADAVGKFYMRHQSEAVHVETCFALSPTMQMVDDLAAQIADAGLSVESVITSARVLRML